MNMPSPSDLYIAANWLENYDSMDDDDMECYRVMNWLLYKAEEAEFRSACREAGVSVANARIALSHQKNKQNIKHK